MAIHNIMEEIVCEVLVKHKEDLQLTCGCDRCLDDIRAIALNNLSPRYIVQLEHRPYVRAPYTADRQGVTNIMLIVTKAAGIVSQSPRCQDQVSK
ncbi:late competence development ComFB family protein [Sporosarcina sp. FSL K6-2383]|uniref:late competence development ComFB family protein n=1 Tax=Sporosarcina sp. FSL K6-2383 TaxID=2921556 RepID=UPI00315ADA3B